MPFAVAGAVIGAVAGSDSSRRASNTQRDAANRASQLQSESADKQLELQREQFIASESRANYQMARDQQIYEEAIARQEPARQAGLRGLADYQRVIYDGFQYDPHAFDTDRLMNDPGVKFRQEQGENALRRQINAGNGVYSGAAAKALLGYNSNLASQEYGAAYGRAADAEARRKDAYQLQSNQLASLAGIGQTANSASQVAGQSLSAAGQASTNAMNAAGSSYANAASNALSGMASGVSNNIIGAANAQAGNSMYQGDTWANALNGLGSAAGRGSGGGYDYGNALRGWAGTGGAGSSGWGGSVQGNSDYQWDL